MDRVAMDRFRGSAGPARLAPVTAKEVDHGAAAGRDAEHPGTAREPGEPGPTDHFGVTADLEG
jgi:hypothetical protein